MTKKILVTGAGGPAAVCFMNAITDPDVELHAGDIDPFAPGLYLVPPERRHLLKRGSHPQYVDQLFALCVEHGIHAIVPTVDAELLPIARAHNIFRSIDVRVLAADEATLQIALDKWELVQVCSFDVPVPKTRLCTERMRWDDSFPCVVKPRVGSGSRGVYVINEPSGLDSVAHNGRNLVQEFLPGEEYSVDLYVGHSGAVHAAVPRLRLKVDSGVAITSRTVFDHEVIHHACAVASLINLRGVANVQFRRDQRGIPKLLEVNPRFAGTMSLTVRSGVNIPQMALDELFGKPPQPGMAPFQEIGMVRTYRDTYVPTSEIDNMVRRTESLTAESTAPRAKHSAHKATVSPYAVS
jgi:carbamoyl-phosphate synthase large subunit